MNQQVPDLGALNQPQYAVPTAGVLVRHALDNGFVEIQGDQRALVVDAEELVEMIRIVFREEIKAILKEQQA